MLLNSVESEPAATMVVVSASSLTAAALVLALVFWRLNNAPGLPHLRLWGFAWLCMATHNLVGGALIYAWVDEPATSVARSLYSILTQSTHFLQVGLMLLGTYEMERERSVSRGVLAGVVGAAVTAATVATLATLASRPELRITLRYDLRYLVNCLAFAPIAWVLLRAPAAPAVQLPGRALVGWSFLGSSLLALASVLSAASWAPEVAVETLLMWTIGPWIVIHATMAVGLVAWSLGRKSRVAAAQSTALAERTQQLMGAQKMEAIGRLAGGVAHDFNNLLTVIFHINDQLMSTPGLPDSARSALLELRQAARHASRLTSQLLVLSSNKAGEPRVFDVNRIVQNMAPVLRRLGAGRFVLMTDGTPVPAPVRLQRGHIEQILLNLVINARDAILDRGSVHIRVGFDRERAPGRVVLTVSDDGVGMPEEVQQRALEPFFTTKGSHGSGLGLAVVYGIAQQSDGEITIHTVPGRGTDISISWPQASGKIDESEISRMVEPAPGSPRTVLLAEDENAVLAITSRTLEHAGYTVLTAATVDEALRLASSHQGPIDALLTDVLMPGMNGPELAAEVRKVRPEVKVLFFSGYVDEATKALMGADVPLLNKPFTRRQLLHYVQANLG